MPRPAALAALAAAAVLGACAAAEPDPALVVVYPELLPWEATERAVLVARTDCDDVADFEMRSRGWPERPSPGTPQVEFRAAYFEHCMRRKGFETE
jgi:hypothetical protein